MSAPQFDLIISASDFVSHGGMFTGSLEELFNKFVGNVGAAPCSIHDKEHLPAAVRLMAAVTHEVPLRNVVLVPAQRYDRAALSNLCEIAHSSINVEVSADEVEWVMVGAAEEENINLDDFSAAQADILIRYAISALSDHSELYDMLGVVL